MRWKKLAADLFLFLSVCVFHPFIQQLISFSVVVTRANYLMSITPSTSRSQCGSTSSSQLLSYELIHQPGPGSVECQASMEQEPHVCVGAAGTSRPCRDRVAVLQLKLSIKPEGAWWHYPDILSPCPGTFLSQEDEIGVLLGAAWWVEGRFFLMRQRWFAI